MFVGGAASVGQQQPTQKDHRRRTLADDALEVVAIGEARRRPDVADDAGRRDGIDAARIAGHLGSTATDVQLQVPHLDRADEVRR